MGLSIRITEWIKRNKLTTLLLIIVASFFLKNSLFSFLGFGRLSNFESGDIAYKGLAPARERVAPGIGGAARIPPPVGGGEYTPQPEVKDRMVVKESQLSLLVEDVFNTMKKITSQVESVGGYMVESRVSNPSEAASGSITVRIPQQNLDSVLEYFHSIAVRVVSENLRGRDVTDEYVDIEARLATLNKTKAKFEEIMDKASEISDILNIQRELINLQSQIDNLKGRQEYLTQTAKMSKVTVYLSTDELALPYAPAEPWRPQVIFKQAVRSLVGTLRKVVTFAIWIVVYSIIWVPVVAVIYLWKRLKRKQIKPPEGL